MKFALLLTIASIGFAQDCLSGSGPLQEGQERCATALSAKWMEQKFGAIPDASANYNGTSSSLWCSDCVALITPSITVSDSALSSDAKWTFKIDGKDYAFTGTQLAEAVKKASGVAPENDTASSQQTPVEAKTKVQ